MKFGNHSPNLMQHGDFFSHGRPWTAHRFSVERLLELLLATLLVLFVTDEPIVADDVLLAPRLQQLHRDAPLLL